MSFLAIPALASLFRIRADEIGRVRPTLSAEHASCVDDTSGRQQPEGD